MDIGKIIPAAMIYIVWSVLIGFLISYLVSWAVVIAAMIAGIYAGFKTSASKGIANGFLSGLIGGIILGSVSFFVPSISGVPLSLSISGFLTPMSSMIPVDAQIISIPALAIIGSIFGSAGGLMGSVTQLRKIFLFLTLFTLFIFYAALDNVAWWWGKASWNWSMSLVLTHWIDISIALVFALLVTMLAHFLKIY